MLAGTALMLELWTQNNPKYNFNSLKLVKNSFIRLNAVLTPILYLAVILFLKKRLNGG